VSIKLGDALVYLGAKKDGLKKDLDDAQKETNGWVTAVSTGIGIALGDAILGAVGKGITAVGNLGKSVFDFSYQSQQAVRNFQSELGATVDEAEILGKVAQNVWRNNFGKDVGDAANAVGLVRQQLRSLNQEGIQLASQSALAIRDAYGTDVVKSVDAARTLIEDFNLTNQQAWDFIAAGYQRGLDRSGDFLESITEYGPQFNAAQVGAGQFFSMMETGLQGGMLGTDRAIDMFKEFRVRLLDGSTTTAEGLAQIGLSIDEVTTRINNGTLSWTDAFTLVQDGIRNTDDQAVQMQAGVALLGTQFEDMGTQAALGVDMANTSLEDLAGSADKINERYNSLDSFMQGMGRRMTVALSPATDAILEMANDALPSLEAGFQNIEAGAGSFAVGLAAIFKTLVEIARHFFGSFRKTSGDEMGQTAADAGNWGSNIVIQLARGMAAGMTAVVNVINSIASLIAHWFQPHSPPLVAPNIDKWGAGLIDAWVDGALSADVDRLGGVGDRIQAILGNVGSSAALGIFSKASSAIASMFQSMPGADEDTSIVGRILGSRTAIAAAVAEIQNLGYVSTGTYQAVLDTLAPLPDAARAYVAALFEVQQAETAVTRAQEELTRVTGEYDDKLNPLREQLDDMRDAEATMADEKRIASLKQAIARGALNDEQKAQALREIQQRELAIQIRALEDEKETAVDAAQEKLDAAEEERKAAAERLAIQEALVQAGQENNDLIKKQIGLLSSLAGAMSGIGDALGSALGDALSGAEAGNLDDMLAGLGSGLNPEEMADGLQTSIEEAMGELDFESIMADVAAEFAPLDEAAGSLGETFGTLKENINGFLERIGLIDEDGQSTVDWLGTLGDVLVIVGGTLLGIQAAGLITWLAGVIGGVSAAAAGASGAMGTFSAIITALGGPVVWLIAIIGALAAAWATDFMGMRTTLTDLWEMFVIILQLLWLRIVEWDEEVSATFRDWHLRIIEFFVGVGDSMAAMAAKLWLKGNEIKTTFLILQQKIKEEIEKIKGFFEDAKTAVTDMRTLFQEQIDKITEKFSNAKQKVFDFLDQLKGLWEWIKSHTFDISLPSLPGGGGEPDGTRASGGPVSAGGTYLVGEDGPELFTPKSSGAIIPNAGRGKETAVAEPSQPRQVIFTGDIRLGDASAVEAFMSFLQGAADAEDLGGQILQFTGA
jgi:phage-related minor tail protein